MESNPLERLKSATDLLFEKIGVLELENKQLKDERDDAIERIRQLEDELIQFATLLEERVYNG